MTTLDYYLWGAVKHKCYADKPEIIDALKDNIREATLDVLCPVFKEGIISSRADVVWPSRCCDLIPVDYYLWDAVKDKCYVDKPETIYALKDNIRGAIGERQLHTIDNVLKNWTDQVEATALPAI